MGGIVLAGGRSSRMGSNKACLDVDGESLLIRAISALCKLPGRIVVVGDAISQGLVSGVETIRDLYPGAGPIGGIVSGLVALGSGLHTVIACDMPDVRLELLEYLLGAYRDGNDAVIPMVGGQPEPLCAVYAHTAVAPLQTYLDEGRRSARGALERLCVIRIWEEALRSVDPDLGSFTNLNTPEELELRRARRRNSGQEDAC